MILFSCCHSSAWIRSLSLDCTVRVFHFKSCCLMSFTKKSKIVVKDWLGDLSPNFWNGSKHTPAILYLQEVAFSVSTVTDQNIYQFKKF